MESEGRLVFFFKCLCRLFVDGLSQIGHDLALYVDNIETIGAGISQFVCILQEKSFCLYQIGRMIRNGKAGIRSRLFTSSAGRAAMMELNSVPFVPRVYADRSK